MKIGTVSKLTSIGIETIRFYERLELIEAPERSTGGYRNYAPDVIRRLSFIKKGKTLGFTLQEIKDLLSLRFDPHSRREDVKTKTITKISEIEAKIKDLQKMRKALTKLIKACEGQGSSTQCPILDAMDG